MYTHIHNHTVLDDKSTCMITTPRHIPSLTYCELSSIATHLNPEVAFKQFTQTLRLKSALKSPTKDIGALMAKSDCHFESLKLLTATKDNVTLELHGERVSKALTRENMVHKLRELEYDSLAVALESGVLSQERRS